MVLTGLQQKHQNNFNICLNHLFVVYTFLLPISPAGYSMSFIFFLILVLFILRGNYKTYLLESIRHPIVIAFFIYASMFYIWQIGTTDINSAEAVLKYAKFALYPILFFSFLDKRFSLWIISSFLLGMMFCELLSYSIHFNLLPWKFYLTDITFPWKSHPLDIRLYRAHTDEDPSPFLHHVFYTSALALSATILLHRLLTKRMSLIFTTLALFFTLTMTMNIFIVGGRIGYVLYIILIITLLTKVYKKKVYKPLILSFSVLAIIVSLAYSSNGIFSKRIDESINTINQLRIDPLDFNSSLGERIGMWYYSIDVIKDNFIFGVGTGDDMNEVKSKITNQKDAHIKSMPDIHSQYFSVLVQFGIIGLLIYLFLIYQIIKYDTGNNTSNTLKLFLAITIIVVGFTGNIAFFYLPLFVVLLSALTVNQEVIQGEFPRMTSKLAILYIFMISLSLIVEKLQ